MEGIPEGAGQMMAPPQAQAPAGGGGPLEALRQHPNFGQLRAQLQADPQSLPQVLQGFGASNPAIAQAIQANLPAFIEMMNEVDDEDDDGGDEDMGMPGMPGMGDINPQMLMQLMAMVQQMPPEQRAALLAQTGITEQQLQMLAPMMQQMAQNPAMMQQMMGGMGGQPGAGQAPPPGTVQIQLSPEDVAAIDRLAEITQRDKNECLQAYMACDKNEEMAANFLFTNPQDD
jgi:UV excision repair protein RAD23